jgi:inorganic pyrophosphatase
MQYTDIPIGDNAPDVFTVVVEIPKGSANKYEYDPDLKVFRLDRTLYSPMHYPGDYGFVPSTIAAAATRSTLLFWLRARRSPAA